MHAIAVPAIRSEQCPRGWSLPAAAVLFAVACLAAPARAQDESPASTRLYDVELIVFQNLDAQAYASPEFEAELPAALPDAAAPPAAPEEPVPAIEPDALMGPAGEIDLPPERFQLNAIEGALRRSAGYRPLAHIGWSQPVAARGAAEDVPLGSRFDVPGLAGDARLAAGRFLHLTLDVEWTGEDGRVHRIETTRRMKSGERHYFDDPAFGVIAVVTRRDDSG